MGFSISERGEARRSRKIAKRNSKIEHIESQRFKSEKDLKTIEKLKGKNAQDEKLNEIATRKATAKPHTVITKTEINNKDSFNKKTGVNDVKVSAFNNNSKGNKPKKTN